jgi:VIT1/CCC1 family predicted Fe2+/Mn2+ transporter
MIHKEQHFTATDTVKDVVIGMSDGLTVPFALAAGLTGAIAATSLIVTAGFAEIAAGSIAMGLGGYLAARTELEHYNSERHREEVEVIELPDVEKEEVREVLTGFGLTNEEAKPVVEALSKNHHRWVDFMMRFELGLEKPDPKRALKSAVTIALSYVIGGIIPLSPYIFMSKITSALWTSIIVTLIALFSFGMIKGKFTGVNPLKAGTQTILIGGLAAAFAFLIARWIS